METGYETRQAGRILRLVEERGFGFIAADNGNGEDVFFLSKMASDFDLFEVGDRVTFTTYPHQGRVRAADVHFEEL